MSGSTTVVPATSGGRSEEYYPTLDGWRAVAIAGVTIAHSTYAVFRPGGTQPNPLAFALTRYGALGVDLFFGISGFLICSRLLREFERHGSLDLRRFYVRRAFRIFPPYLFTLLIVSLLAAAGLIPLSRAEFWTSLAFVRNYLPSANEQSGWYTAHFWSLSAEEHFYLLWPMLLLWWRPRRAPGRVAILACGIGIWRAAEFRLGVVAGVLPGAPFYTRTDVRIDALLWGCFVALVLRDAGRRARFRAIARPSVCAGIAGLYVASVVASPPFAMAWQAMLVPLLLAGTTLRPQMAVSRMLEHRAARWIGRLSYSLYLWQTPFFAFSAASAPLGALQSLPLNLVGLFAAAVVSYYAIERPMIGVGRRVAAVMTKERLERPPLADVAQTAAL